MKIKEIYFNLKNKLNNNKKILICLSLIFTLLFSIYNRVIGAIKQSLWHELISIYYFVLVCVKTIIILYVYKRVSNKNDKFIFILSKILLLISNALLVVPITLMILDKRVIEMDLILSIAVALYVTIKTTKVIINYVKKRKEDVLSKQLRTIELMDVVVSILTLQNTLITVNGEYDLGLYNLTIISSFIGLAINIFLIVKLRYIKSPRIVSNKE